MNPANLTSRGGPPGGGLSMLSPYRVLDLSDGRGALCGRALADLGADVIKLEPPWGDPARRIGPFYQDDPHPEKSLFWAFCAANKRSVTLDLTAPAGRPVLEKLLASSHFLIESFRPGHLDNLGLGWDDLKGENPSLIYVSITPFGQNGPYRDYQATDLIGMALSGMMHLTGDPDRPPVRISTPQFWATGSAAAAAGATIANHYRLLTGRGQRVDVSCQQAVARALSHAPMLWDMNRLNMQRQGPFRPVGSVNLRINWECRDGYVNFIQPGGHTGGLSMTNLSNWMDEEGLGHAVLRDTNWGDIGFGQLSRELLEEMTPPLERFFMTKTKAQLAREALERRILLFPVHDPKDVFAYPQLLARGFFGEVPLPSPEGEAPGVMKALGPFFKSTVGPGPAFRGAPRIGQHNNDVYRDEMGLSDRQLAKLKEDGVI